MIEVRTSGAIKITKPADGSGEPWTATLPDGRTVIVLPDEDDARIARRHRVKLDGSPPQMALYARLGGVYVWFKHDGIVITTQKLKP